MERTNVKEEPAPETSWSETTTPASDDIEVEEAVRYSPPPRLRLASQGWGTHPRIFRDSIRRRVRPEDYSKVGGIQGQHSFSIPMLDLRRSMEGSDVSSSSSITLVTSAGSSCTDPWSSSSGFVEEEEDDDDNWGREDNKMDTREGSFLDEDMVVPKLEPIEEDVNLADMKPIFSTPTESSPAVPVKRPRGRPRKHPKISPEDKLKIAKNRSKTGCVTCRRRKKKCDERKPGCLNCEKNSAICEGYQPKTVWKSGKEKAEEGTTMRLIRQQSADELIPSTANLMRISRSLPPILTGVETPGDLMFLEHYIYRLSPIFTAEGEENNAFKDIFLPMAQDHSGLMHSILALASKHIDYHSPYGVQFLKEHPDVTVEELDERSHYHQSEALAQLQRDQGSATMPATLAQMLFQVLQTLSDPRPTGEHRFHLTHYRNIITESPPEQSKAVQWIHELMQYHIYADELVCLPESRVILGAASDDWELPPAIVQPDAVRLLGVSDGLFLYMSKITNLRNTIREAMQRGDDPVVNANSMCRAANIGLRIGAWTPAWPPGDKRDPAGELYKHMMWVYLYRTIYPPRKENWKISPKLIEAVNNGIEILSQFGPRDPNQTLCLAPAFVFGCAAFEKPQRAAIRKAIGVVKSYMEYKNSDTALEVLEEVWRLMDAKDERSWDWQTVVHTMGMDFLPT